MYEEHDLKHRFGYLLFTIIRRVMDWKIWILFVKGFYDRTL